MTKPANPLRGEAEFGVAGETYLLRPSFEALVAAEEELGSLFALVERASDGCLTLAEMSALLWHCMPSDSRPTREVIGSAVIQVGMVAATKPIRAILSQVLQGQR